jgi:periplasmic divalent cation tolerance protein
MTESLFQIVLTTCPDMPSAEKIAHALVNERLAACVNILPAMRSSYIWQGKIETAAEHLLLIKAPADRYQAIEERVQMLHPYELPEIIAVPIQAGSNGYLSWLKNPDK